MPARKEIVVDGVNVIETKNSFKIWFDNLGRYFYKSKDKDYYKNYFDKIKKLIACEHCGRSVTCQYYNHLKSQFCQNARKIKEESVQKSENEV